MIQTKHKLLHGDCLEQLSEVADHSVHAMVTNPPRFHGSRATEKQQTPVVPWTSPHFVRWALPRLKLCYQKLLPGAHVFVKSTALYTAETLQAMDYAGFILRGRVTVARPIAPTEVHNITPVGRKMTPTERTETGDLAKFTCYFPDTTDDWWLFKTPNELPQPSNIVLYGTGAVRKKRSSLILDRTLGGFDEDDLFSDTSPCENMHHPWPANLEVVEELLRVIVPPDGTVLDPFCGTGTVALAAALNAYSSVNIDNNLEYLKHADQRLQQARLGRLANWELKL